MVSILTYHNIGRRLELGLPAVGRKRLGDHLDLLISLDRPLVRAREAVSPVGADGIAVTFDDGYQSVYTDAFPEMEARRVVGTVFPVVASIGGTNSWDVRRALRPLWHLSWAELEDLVKHGFEVGSHTMSHRDLTRLSDRDLKRELAMSKLTLEDRLGVEVVSLAYPFGRATGRVMEAAAGFGYRCGFGSTPEGITRDGLRDLGLGRMSVYGIDGRANLRAKLGLGAGRRLEVAKNKVIARLSHGTTLVKR